MIGYPEGGVLKVNDNNNVEATFNFIKRIVRLVAFDSVALTLLLVWTGL